MRIAVVFDTPYAGWDRADHERQMDLEIAAWKADEALEYLLPGLLEAEGYRYTGAPRWHSR